MKYLVTGSSGFIGTHLCKKLKAQHHEIIVCDIKDQSGDIRSLDLGINNIDEIDGIFHLAAIASVQRTIDDPESTFETNVAGARNVFSLAKVRDIPVVYASSAAVYGDNNNLPLSEAETPAPLSPYAEHKLRNEIDANKAGIKSFGVRFFNIYGPGQDPSSPYSGVISIFHNRLKDKRPITIFGRGAHSRDFVYVEDAVQALLLGMKHAGRNAPVANVCTGKQNTLLELAHTLGAALNITPQIHFEAERAGDIVHSCGNPSKLEKLMGFRPQTDLSTGIQALVKAET